MTSYAVEDSDLSLLRSNDRSDCVRLSHLQTAQSAISILFGRKVPFAEKKTFDCIDWNHEANLANHPCGEPDSSQRKPFNLEEKVKKLKLIL